MDPANPDPVQSRHDPIMMHTLTMALVLFPLTNIDCTIRVSHRAVANIIVPDSGIEITVPSCHISRAKSGIKMVLPHYVRKYLSIPLPVGEAPLVLVAVGEHEPAGPLHPVVDELSNVFGQIRT